MRFSETLGTRLKADTYFSELSCPIFQYSYQHAHLPHTHIQVRRLTDNLILVLKQVTLEGLSEREMEETRNEVEVMRQLQHDHIIRYYDSFTENTTLNIVMEYAPCGDLAMQIKTCIENNKMMEEDVVWKYLIQLLQGLKYIHEQRVLHRDIKAHNVFLDINGNVKIGDFGLGRILGPQSRYAYTAVGTPLYFSPELCEEKRYNERSDIWSLGCLLYELTSLRPPFTASNQLALAKKIVNDQPAR
jgi:serine/threonine protein kinase